MATIAVIGAGWGDEGKGLLTDALCEKLGPNTIVVRHNGGAQAAHTVQINGRPNIFHHVGSGWFRGCPTYLTEDFVLNPLLWEQEIIRLQKESRPPFFLSRLSPVTTPYDMLINQYAEMSRGLDRHGSCGVGINETVTRTETDEFAFLSRNMREPVLAKKKLDAIRREYVPQRLKHLGLTPNAWFQEMVDSSSLAEGFLQSCANMASRCSYVDGDIITKYDNCVFEGAQGLLLDQGHEFFPHVTRSNTGTQNVTAITNSLVLDLEIYYVIRTYLTRHGAGPFPTEDFDMEYEDLTNQPNDWQHSLRFGAIDIPLVANAITKDRGERPANLFITHGDQRSAKEAIDLKFEAGLTLKGISYGPEATDIVWY